ncbi:MAG TPA: PHP domain-containing protein [Deltaproteobacteria bacterium]|nr:PHP domain-containing protein [Deltaproteobacteria bacterium]
MDNRRIAGLLREAAEALEYLDEPFKARAYRKAASTVADMQVPLAELAAAGRLTELDGIGKGLETLLTDWAVKADFQALQGLRAQLPAGISEIRKVPGLGNSKIKALHALGVETLEDLADACDSGRLSGLKGFTARHIGRIRRAVDDIMAYRGRFLLDEGLSEAHHLLGLMADAGITAVLTGECRRGYETLAGVEILITETPAAMAALDRIMGEPDIMTDRCLSYMRERPVPVNCHIAPEEGFVASLFLSTGSRDHTDRIASLARAQGLAIRPEGVFAADRRLHLRDEEALYARLGLSYIPPELREEGGREIELAGRGALPELIDAGDIVGTIHNHTTFSDGKTPPAELVAAARELGYAWIGISDHSVSARYAGGMNLKAVKKQHLEIEALRGEAGIEVLKGVECDIQPDGSLDYPDEVLAGFDFVIASIHTQMDMDASAMTDRIITALRNPRTSILAHPTGRLLLARSAYALDIDAVLEEAIRQRVVVELNAHPWRLDLDWRLIERFTAAGGMIAISPDAHERSGLKDMRYGIMMARKGMLTAAQCLNSLDSEHARQVLRRCA